MMTAPFFKSHEDFNYFRRETFDRRYFRSENTDQFLAAVLDSCSSRVLLLKEGDVLYRAQLGHDWRTDGPLGGQVPCPFPPERMKPLGDRAHEGRINPKGIPCLYAASTREAAISEMRPGISAQLSVARLEIVRDLKIIDCNRKVGPFVGIFQPPDDKIDETVWATIDRAFGEPVIRVEDRADYAATQIIAELFRINGYDGIAFTSQFDPDGFNVALFNLTDAQQTECHIFRTTAVKYTFNGPWGGY
jgi:hypothetical protein